MWTIPPTRKRNGKMSRLVLETTSLFSSKVGGKLFYFT
nr:MAG TPA: hypothetical protein [Caudoviricetes sp.]